jgi:hypothetical protein
MEMSGFSETQLQVREAVGKICEDFPDVSMPSVCIFLWFLFAFGLSLYFKFAILLFIDCSVGRG